MDLRNFNGFKLRNYYFTTEKFSSEVEKCIMWSSINSGTSNQVSKKSFYTFEDIDLRESHAK